MSMFSRSSHKSAADKAKVASPDQGPWVARDWGGVIAINSTDPKHEVMLSISGVFDSIEQQYLYATALADWLNANLEDAAVEHVNLDTSTLSASQSAARRIDQDLAASGLDFRDGPDDGFEGDATPLDHAVERGVAEQERVAQDPVAEVQPTEAPVVPQAPAKMEGVRPAFWKRLGIAFLGGSSRQETSADDRQGQADVSDRQDPIPVSEPAFDAPVSQEPQVYEDEPRVEAVAPVPAAPKAPPAPPKAPTTLHHSSAATTLRPKAAAAAAMGESALENLLPPMTEAFGCHCDLNPGDKPDACVWDLGAVSECSLAASGITKTACEYWQPIVIHR